MIAIDNKWHQRQWKHAVEFIYEAKYNPWMHAYCNGFYSGSQDWTILSENWCYARTKERERDREMEKRIEEKWTQKNIIHYLQYFMKKRTIYRCAMHNNRLINNLFLLNTLNFNIYILPLVGFGPRKMHCTRDCVCRCLIKSMTLLDSCVCVFSTCCSRFEIMCSYADKYMCRIFYGNMWSL